MEPAVCRGGREAVRGSPAEHHRPWPLVRAKAGKSGPLGTSCMGKEMDLDVRTPARRDQSGRNSPCSVGRKYVECRGQAQGPGDAQGHCCRHQPAAGSCWQWVACKTLADGEQTTGAPVGPPSHARGLRACRRAAKLKPRRTPPLQPDSPPATDQPEDNASATSGG